MEFLFEYGLFLAKAVTLLVSVLLFVIVVIGLSQRNRPAEGGHIEVKSVNQALEGLTSHLKQLVLNPAERKFAEKADKKRLKDEQKAQKKQAKANKEGDAESRNRVFVVDFEGDIQASAVSSLREEVTAILAVASENDEVVIRLESQGGVVHGYGLAASQLSRIVSKNIPLTVSVDKVAASGGYMMACIANQIIAAPFAILGSIGVAAQIPNFYRFLKNKDVDVEVLTAGEYKRTLTMWGENTDKGREKFVDELEDVHALFKSFVADNRPAVNIETVSTGEAWYGTRALEQELIDKLMTSDEFITEKCEHADVFLVKFVEHKNKIDRVFDRFTGMLNSMGLTGLHQFRV
ncbi:MAG: protease SohB [Pseudomonadales bacterium]|nr:protease SohB [Pseudomonadales bacterium]